MGSDSRIRYFITVALQHYGTRIMQETLALGELLFYSANPLMQPHYLDLTSLHAGCPMVRGADNPGSNTSMAMMSCDISFGYSSAH